jgi:hypothetical protein
MPYILPVMIVNNTDDVRKVVEKTCWYYANGGTWTDDNSHNLVHEMGGSGTSGMLRIKAASGYTFSVIVGFHNSEFWCDAQVVLPDDDTAVKLHPEYYIAEVGCRRRRTVISNGQLQPGKQWKSTCRDYHVVARLPLSHILEEAGISSSVNFKVDAPTSIYRRLGQSGPSFVVSFITVAILFSTLSIFLPLLTIIVIV